MRILLFGEYSNVHHTLCEALRRAGHEVLLISDGDGWKDYPRDIDLRRRQPGPIGSLRYLAKLVTLLPKLRGFDVVQLINPVFIDVKARWNRLLFDYLRRHNRMVSVGCFGDDTYVIRRMQDPACFEYSDLQVFGHPIVHETNHRRISNWLHPDKVRLTEYVMAKADCLIACLYEYYKVYDLPEFRSKLHYVALPVSLKSKAVHLPPDNGKTKVLFAVQKSRGQMKGTDQLEPLFDRLAAEYPGQIELTKITSVPFNEYQRLVAVSDVVIDQLYSYTPAMAALESLSQGKVVISGYEHDYARFLGEEETGETGIVNLRPQEAEANYAKLVQVLTDISVIRRLQLSALAFVRKHHDADQVAADYLSVWSSASGVGVVSSSSR